MIKVRLKIGNKSLAIIGFSGLFLSCCRRVNQLEMALTGCKSELKIRENYDDVESELIEQDRAQEQVNSFVPQAYNMPRSYDGPQRVSPVGRTDHCKYKVTKKWPSCLRVITSQQQCQAVDLFQVSVSNRSELAHKSLSFIKQDYTPC